MSKGKEKAKAKETVIALDAMGGEGAPAMVVHGAAQARGRDRNLRFLIFGDEAQLAPLVARQRKLRNVVDIHHTDEVVADTVKPSVALRSGKNSSMGLAIEAVRSGAASGAVSAGNTGALMALSMLGLRNISGVDRPAICAILPTMRGRTCVLDLGANVQCGAHNLVQFAIMGEVFARVAMQIECPSVGLLNIGVEDMKGKDEIKLAASSLRNLDAPFNFTGFVEGDDITAGVVDVVVTDGFTGNVALKTLEGTARLFSNFLRQAYHSGLFARAGYLLSMTAINGLRRRMDPRNYNGAVFLGLNGIVVKSHGSTDERGFANAVIVAAEMFRHGYIDKMREDFDEFRPIDNAR